jgi:hypothetical protein
MDRISASTIYLAVIRHGGFVGENRDDYNFHFCVGISVVVQIPFLASTAVTPPPAGRALKSPHPMQHFAPSNFADNEHSP